MGPILDMQYFNNNNVLAIRPNEIGRLKELVLQNADGESRVWVFRNIVVSKDDQGNERFDYKSRGLSVGTFAEGEALLKQCARLGFDVGYVKFYVPTSNPQKVIGFTHDTKRPILDYPEGDLALVRLDPPPSVKILVAILEAEQQQRSSQKARLRVVGE